jgi:signal transduction histidine kinase
VLVELAVIPNAFAQGHQKQVLALYSTRRDSQIAIVGDRELPRVLENGLPEGLDYYSEFIDQGRLSEDSYQEAFGDFLRLKYAGHRFDVVIVVDNVALEYVDRLRAEVFPDTPVVFFSSRPSPRRIPNSTGVAVEANLTGTLSLVANLQPDVRNVFVVTGADTTYEALARKQFAPFQSRFAFTYLSALPTADLEARLSGLPPRSIVYYVHVNRDGAGENFNPIEYLDRITATANAPTYSWVDSAFGRGVVGGNLRSLTSQMEAIGSLALRVLRGEDADSIPVIEPDLNSSRVDWRQLRRWSISEGRVPVGTIVDFREPSAWSRYKGYMLAALVVLLAQTGLIAGLLVQSRRRRLAEEMVRGSEIELRKSYERSRDLGARLLRAQESERSRIARELHDDISQQMALLEIDLELAGDAVDGGRARGMLDGVLGRAHGIAKSVHDLSHRLHPAKLRLIGLVPALQGLQRELSGSGIAITVTHTNLPLTIPQDVTLCLFRIVQEALQNAVKYSQCRTVSVHLKGAGEGVTMTIVDDGVGFDVDAAWGKGLGLISMSERVEAIGGTFGLRSKPGAGTRLGVTVPSRILQNTEPTDS